MNLYRTHQYIASAELGYLTLNLGQGVSGAKIRAAIIATRNPDTGAAFPTRLAAGEVIWSKFYPIGSQVNVDLGGLAVQTKGFIPPTIPLSPDIMDSELRFMLALYWESGTPVAFTLDAELTYVAHTVVDTNQ
jgi:hypothetical protein